MQKEKAAESGDFQIVCVDRSNAGAVGGVFHSVYGADFPVKDVYEPDTLAGQIEAGRVIAFLALDGKGNAAGYVSLFRSAPNPRLWEAGNMVVHPDYRFSNLSSRLAKLYYSPETLSHTDCDGIFGEAVSHHYASQIGSVKSGMHDCAVELDLMPGDSFKDHPEVAGRRVSCVFNFFERATDSRILYVPAEYDEIVRKLAQPFHARTFLPADTALPLTGSTVTLDTYYATAKTWKVAVREVGADFPAFLDQLLVDAASRQVVSLQVAVNAALPATGVAVRFLRERGFFLGGFLPRWFGGDGLLLQKVFGVAPDYDHMKIYSKPAKELLAMIRADREMVNRTVFLSQLAPAEQDRLQRLDRATVLDLPPVATMLDLFLEQAARLPDHPAVVDGDRSFSYRELNARADQLAQRLIHQGVGAGDLVAILIERSAEMVIAALAVWKAGGAYAPINPQYPAERRRYILEDTGCSLVLTSSAYAAQDNFPVEALCLDDPALWREVAAEPAKNPVGKDLAYVIYTSGSTGNPKGVMIEHRALLNMCCWYRDSHGLQPSDHKAQCASFAFDASVLEIFPGLAAGATLYIVPDKLLLWLSGLNKFFERNRITIASLTTPLGEMFLRLFDNRSLRFLDIGGDTLKRFTPRNYQVLNSYGPTEYTVCTSDFSVDRQYDNFPIGRPVWNTAVYVLDGVGRRQPVGEPGELCVAGAGIARGYLNRPDLTAEKFVEDPLCPGQKMYRTGDLGRQLPDGNLEFLGRMDFQVKIRGFRVELGEIEQALIRQAGVREAVVVDRLDPAGSKFLCAYVTVEFPVAAEVLQQALSQQLPDYMVPAYIVKLERLPLNFSGKIDRKALPDPSRLNPHE